MHWQSQVPSRKAIAATKPSHCQVSTIGLLCEVGTAVCRKALAQGRQTMALARLSDRAELQSQGIQRGGLPADHERLHSLDRECFLAFRRRAESAGQRMRSSTDRTARLRYIWTRGEIYLHEADERRLSRLNTK